ncbi:MAG: restriction endonuclease [Thermofilaceae archaeon]
MITELVYLMLTEILKRKTVHLAYLEGCTGLTRDLLVDLLNGFPVRFNEDQVVVVDAADLLLACWKRGFDPVRLALKAEWKDFEILCAKALAEYGFRALTHVRLKREKRIFEIDVVAFNYPRILAVECKRWTRLRLGGLKTAARQQKLKCEILAKRLTSIHSLRGFTEGWDKAKIIPALVNLHEGDVKIFEGVALVPLYKLKCFLNELPSYEEELFNIHLTLSERVR